MSASLHRRWGPTVAYGVSGRAWSLPDTQDEPPGYEEATTATAAHTTSPPPSYSEVMSGTMSAPSLTPPPNHYQDCAPRVHTSGGSPYQPQW